MTINFTTSVISLIIATEFATNFQTDQMKKQPFQRNLYY